ncbi:MAG: hypothetical protein ABII00_11105 [Elusimicrobiota bacterium]
MRVPAAVLALLMAFSCLARPAHAGRKGRAPEKPPAQGEVKAEPERVAASSDTIRLVEFFLAAETGDLPYEAVPQFMEVDPEALPRRLRDRYRAKRTELLALRKIAEGKKKPPLRRLGVEDEPVCSEKVESQRYVDTLLSMGFLPITEDEENFLIQKTKCTECELQEEFSLTVVIVPPKKKKGRPTRHLLLKDSDPLALLVELYREARGNITGTKFFGVGMQPACR